MAIEIKNIDGEVLYTAENAPDIKAAVEAAVKEGADLRKADLRKADLRKANLRKADLRKANLERTKLKGTNLKEADLVWAKLREADLRGANLGEANLGGANLGWTNLEGTNLRGANLGGANLEGTNLRGANLEKANLGWANLSGTNLREADLRDADLGWAYLKGADLAGAYLKGDFRNADITSLCILRDQPGTIRAYKLVKASGEGPFNGGIKYEIGQEYSVENANTDERKQCAAGINLATLNWCRAQHYEGYRILIAEFTAADIAAIPIGTDGKFRVRRCKIVGEWKEPEVEQDITAGVALAAGAGE